MTTPMNVTDILFASLGNLTGGLITDLQTAMVGMIAVAFIVFGFDHLKEVFEDNIKKRNTDKALRDAREYRRVMDNQYVDPTIRDMYRAKYRSAIRRASE